MTATQYVWTDRPIDEEDRAMGEVIRLTWGPVDTMGRDGFYREDRDAVFTYGSVLLLDDGSVLWDAAGDREDWHGSTPLGIIFGSGRVDTLSDAMDAVERTLSPLWCEGFRSAHEARNDWARIPA